MIYRHKATGLLFRWLAAGYDVTHKCMCAVYCPDDNEHSIMTMSQEQFDQEMEPQPGPEVGE